MSTEIKTEEDFDCYTFESTSELKLENDIIKVEVDGHDEERVESLEIKSELKNTQNGLFEGFQESLVMGVDKFIDVKTIESSKRPVVMLTRLNQPQKKVYDIVSTENEVKPNLCDNLENFREQENVQQLYIHPDIKPSAEQASLRDSSPDRSRSPLHFSQESAAQPMPDGNDRMLDESVCTESLVLDSHKLYVSSEEIDRNNHSRRTSKRGESGSGRPNGSCEGKQQWEMGHPLQEIWMNDEEVPPQVVRLVNDVMMNRLTRNQGAARVERDDSSDSEDEFIDSSDGVNTIPRLEDQNLHFEWSTMETAQGQEESFTPERTGSVRVFDSAYNAFRSYWSDDILDFIVTETNLHASKISHVAFRSGWFPTNRHEILCLFVFWMMLGIIRMPNIAACFSDDPPLRTEIFRRIFTRKRYEMLNRAVYFFGFNPAVSYLNPYNTGTGSSDQLHRLRPIIKHLNSAFQAHYVCSRDICIDRSLTLWKGRLNYGQYIRTKPNFGIKTFELCESSTGYLWSFIVYTGDQSSTDLNQMPGDRKSTAVVKKLIGPLLNKGYRLFMDDWYSSPLLARFLKHNGTDCFGTLKSFQSDIPGVINKVPLKKGECIARHSGDVTILSWQDKQRITMISTCHGSSAVLPTVSSRADYHKFMGEVDLKDQLLEPYLIEKEFGERGYMKLFKRLLNVSILNSRILVQSSTDRYHSHLSFRLQLVDTILEKHSQQNRRSTSTLEQPERDMVNTHLLSCPKHCSKNHSNTVCNTSTLEQPKRRVVNTHWPALLEQSAASLARNRKFSKRCVVCLREGRKTIKSTYCCETCRVPLCLINCFKSYHTQPQ